MLRKLSLFPASFLFIQTAFSLTSGIQNLLDSLRTAGNFPRLGFAIVYKDNLQAVYTSGSNDKEKKILLKPSDRMLQGSVGKT